MYLQARAKKERGLALNDDKKLGECVRCGSFGS